MKRIMLSLAAVLLTAGCAAHTPGEGGTALPEVQDSGKVASSPAPTAKEPEEAYAAENSKGLTEPFWGPPGTTVLAQDGTMLSQSLKPIPFAGRLLQPVKLDYVTYLVHAEAGELWLDGTIYDMIDRLSLSAEPEPLLALPYRTGDTWAFWGGDRGPRAVGFQELTTPAGAFPTVVAQDPESGEKQWWSPGRGLVKQEGRGRALVAAQIEQRTPGELAQVRPLTPDLAAIIANERIYDQTGRVLADFLFDWNSGRRPSAGWQEIGAPYPVVQWGTFSQGDPNWKMTFWAYEPKTGTFQQLQWYFPDGSVRTELVGSIDLRADQKLFHDDYAYPWGEYSFRYADGAMRASGERLVYADTAADFAHFLTRYLNQQSFVGLFADPAVGARAYAWAHPDGRYRLAGCTASHQPDGSWLLDGRSEKVRFTLVPHGRDFRITSWQAEP